MTAPDPVPLAAMTANVERFLAQLAIIEPEQARQMRMTWDMEDPEPRKAAWTKAGAALKAAGRGAEIEELRDGVNSWAGDKAWNIMDQFGGGSPERARQEARRAALPPVMDAGLATIAADLLDQDERYALTKPFRTGLSGESGRARRSGRSVRRSPTR
jgi:hypothetical protein